MSTSHGLLTRLELEQGLAEVLASPRTAGVLKAVVVRPAEGERRLESAAKLTREGGLEGDRWARHHWQRLADGRPDPRSQLSIMNWRALALISGEEERLALAGDNLVVDFDLSEANLPAGSRLEIGADVVIEISEVPHTGCHKFTRRFGPQACEFVNSPRGRSLHLRGRYASVVREGSVQIGDRVAKC